MNLRISGVILVVGLSLLGALVLGVTGVPWGGSQAGPAMDGPADAGGSVCVAGGGVAERAVDLVLVAPPGDAAAPQGPGTGRAILLAVDDDGTERTAVGPYRAGSVEVVTSELGSDGWLWTGWADHPLFTWREWRSPGGPGEPRASVVSRCITADAPRWVVLGLRTDGGNEALLEIANPYVVDATFAVTLRTEAEVFEPIALRNVSVPARARLTVRLNDYLPEESEIAAVVTVGAGRLAVEGLQRATAGVGGVEGVSTVPALTTPSDTWTFPWVATGPDVDGSIWILNPEARAVVVETVVHTTQGAALPELIESIEVPAEALVRVDVADLAPAGGRVFGLTLRSATTGVYVAAGARFLSEDPTQSGLVRLIASSVPDREWLDAGRQVPDRANVLHIVNLSERVAELRIVLTSSAGSSDGSSAGPAEAGAAPDAAGPETRVLEPGTLAPGAVVRIPLPLDGRAAWSALVTGGDALVVSRTTTGTVLLEPVAIDALPSRAWRAPMRGAPGAPLDGWVARLGTSGDLRPAVRPAG